MPKKLIPLIAKPSVRPIKYYDIVGDIMVEFMKNRRVAIIKQTDTEAHLITRVKHEDGTPLPILINDKGELIKYVKSGSVDFMTSVTMATSTNVNMLMIDIKGGRRTWLSVNGLRALNAAVLAVKVAFEKLGLTNNCIVFDGMNGFKVISKLSDEVNNEVVKGFVKIVVEGVVRGLKGVGVFHDYEDDIVIGGNTVTKVKMFRVPLSLHWSTKLSAIPVVDVESFITKMADPANVIMSMSTIKKLLEPLSNGNPVDTLVNFIDRFNDYEVPVIYEVKAAVRASLASLLRN